MKFRVVGETAVVKISEIKNFDRESHEDKCYMVRWSPADVMTNSAGTSESISKSNSKLANSKKNKKGRPTTFFRSKRSKSDENSSDDDSMEDETDEYYRGQILLFFLSYLDSRKRQPNL